MPIPRLRNSCLTSTGQPKRQYDTREEAEKAARDTAATVHVPMDVFRCGCCGKFHVGRKRKR